MSVHPPYERGPIVPAALTPFIGREALIASIGELLSRDDVRLLTLTGTGGVGKTRLALRVAEEIAVQFQDGVVFVPLAAVEDADLVGATIARAAGARGPGDVPVVDRLAATLVDRQLLLVLDNFEHVVTAAPVVTEILVACPSVKVLVTSRAVLRISGERTVAVPPLGMPDLSGNMNPRQAGSLEDELAAEAVRLFVDRAQAVKADFVLGSQNAPVVAEICRRVDGLPLAIELAASRIAVLPPAALLGRLDRRLPLLTGGARDLPTRQQTMRGAIAWSYGLLNPAEQQLFRRLSVFVGGFTLDTAESVVEGSGNHSNDASLTTLDLIASLVGSSLVQQLEGSGGEPRFVMLETLREFGLEQLEASGEADATRVGHAAAFVRFAELAGPELAGPDQPLWVERIEAELGNIRAALAWLEDRGEVGSALRLMGALSWIWAMPGLCREGFDRIRLLASHPDAERFPADLADVLSAAANIADILSDRPAAKANYERALNLYRFLGDSANVAGTLRGLGSVAIGDEEMDLAKVLLEEALAIARGAGDTWNEAAASHHLGAVALAEGDLDRSMAYREAALAGWRSCGGPLHVARALLSIGWVAQAMGEFHRALDAYREFVVLVDPLIDDWLIAESLMGVAGLTTAAGHPHHAVRLMAASQAIRERIGIPAGPVNQRIVSRMMASSHADLGEEAFAAAWSEGQALSLAEAAADVQSVVTLSLPESMPAPDVRPAALRRLTPREIEVLHLIAAGRTDREIGEALFVSRRTVSKHVESILAKLGVASRAAAASEAVRHGLA